MVKVFFDVSLWQGDKELMCWKGGDTYETWEQAAEAVGATAHIHALRMRGEVSVGNRDLAMLVLLSPEKAGEETIVIRPENGQAIAVTGRPVPLTPQNDDGLHDGQALSGQEAEKGS